MRIAPRLLILLCAGALVHVGVYADETAAPEARPSWYQRVIPETPVTRSAAVGANSERLLPDLEFTLWVSDEKGFAPNEDDRVVFATRTIEDVAREELPNVVPVLPYTDAMPEFPASSIRTLRETLSRLREHQRLRIEVTGHSDDAPLGVGDAAAYGDSIGMSRARAGAVARFLQQALDLPEGAIAFDGRGAAEPVASNTTGAGRARNRRVEVRVWFEQVERRELNEEIVIPPPGQRRIKVCRTAPGCIVVRKLPNARRMVLRNFMAPLRFAPGTAEIPAPEIEKLRAVLARHKDKRNLELSFTGHVDSTPIGVEASGRFGDKAGLSRAQATMAARQVRRVLNLPDHQIRIEGAGDQQPLADNGTANGRAQNRRIELSLWYDAPEDVLSVGDVQACPASADGRDFISRRYRPGDQDPIAPIVFRNGQPEIPELYLAQLKGLLERLANEPNLRIHFAGYVDRATLSRRGAMVYGDAWGLSEERAQRVMKLIGAQLAMPAVPLSAEGKGVSEELADDQGRVLGAPEGHVAPEIWFDVPAPRDDNYIVELRKVTRSMEPVNPFELAPLRITVDGKAVDDSLPHGADVQRCTDVALERTRVRVVADSNKAEPRLAVGAWPVTVRRTDDPTTEKKENEATFQAWLNYPAFIDRAELRLHRGNQPRGSEPAYVVALDRNLQARFAPAPEEEAEELFYVVRVYDKAGRFDETRAKRLWIARPGTEIKLPDEAETARVLARVYGSDDLASRTIPLSGGSITVEGANIPAAHRVRVMNSAVPLDAEQRFVAQQLVPRGMHTVEVAVLDERGNGELYLRDLGLNGGDWYYVGLGDLTLGMDGTSGPAAFVTQDTTHYNNSSFIDGRLAFYLKGTTRNYVEVTASADTREGPVDQLFSNFLDKNPRALFRRLDQDYYYPTYGDDSATVEDAPTQGKLYAKVRKGENFGVWGNFKAEWLDSDLARVDRGLYGAYGHYGSVAATGFGERRTRVDGFAAEPGTVRAREEFRGTGGSLYYLQHQDISTGSESLWVEVRDRDSGMVLQTRRLVPGQDYGIDALQGRVQLTSPLPSTADDSQLVQAGSLSGNPVYLIAHYEYTPGFEEIRDVAYGGRVSHWVNDRVKLGLTTTEQQQTGTASGLNAVDVTLRKSAGSYMKLEVANSHGPGLTEQQSSDGGFNFAPTGAASGADVSASATRLEGGVQLGEFLNDTTGTATVYYQQRDAGYSAPGQLAANDTTQLGAALALPLGPKRNYDLRVKLDTRAEANALSTQALSADVARKLDTRWTVTGGLRNDSRTDNSPVVPATQIEGDRTDTGVRFDYDSQEQWTAYGFGQLTLARSNTRDANNRLGAGGKYQINDKWKLHGELSGGDLGLGARFGTDYLQSKETTLYSTYALDNERNVSGLAQQKGSLVSGFRSQTSESLSVYGEERYAHGDVPSGLTHAYGVNLTADDDWRFGASGEVGTLQDNFTGAKTDRKAFALSAGRKSKEIDYTGALEYRTDTTAVSTLDSLLVKNALRYRTNPDWTAIGKLNFAASNSSLGQAYNGEFIEAVLGYAYRPVASDRLNSVFKYTWFYNLPSPDQITTSGDGTTYMQRSHVLSADLQYDLTPTWTIGGKVAYRLGQLSPDRSNPEFFDSRGQLFVLRADWHALHNWDFIAEARVRAELDAQDSRNGMVLGIYRHLGPNLKLGVGYNFTDFSDDLTNYDFTSQGMFINVIGKY